MTDLDSERFTLRQAAQARDDFAQIMDELDFVKEQLARLPTRRDQAFVPLKIMFRVGSHRRRAPHSLAGSVLAPWHVRRPRAIGDVRIGTENLRPGCGRRRPARRGHRARLALPRRCWWK